MSDWTRAGGERRDEIGSAQVGRLVEGEGITELEIVFDLYCEL